MLCGPRYTTLSGENAFEGAEGRIVLRLCRSIVMGIVSGVDYHELRCFPQPLPLACVDGQSELPVCFLPTYPILARIFTL